MENNNAKDYDNSETEPIGEVSISEEEIAELEETPESPIIRELNDKYLRCYAEFENYRKRVNKEKEELVKFGNESLIYELLPTIDSLELALKHATDDSSAGIVQGVEMTLKEIHRTLEKFGMKKIESIGKAFDPSMHHAMMNVEREDMEEKMVAEELRAGYLYHDKVLRPTLVAVSVKPAAEPETSGAETEEVAEGKESENRKIKINKDLEEEE